MLLNFLQALNDVRASATKLGESTARQFENALHLGDSALSGKVTRQRAIARTESAHRTVDAMISSTEDSVRARLAIGVTGAPELKPAVFERYTQLSLVSSRTKVAYTPAGTSKQFSIEHREVALGPNVSIVTREVRRTESMNGTLYSEVVSARREFKVAGLDPVPLPYIKGPE